MSVILLNSDIKRPMKLKLHYFLKCSLLAATILSLGSCYENDMPNWTIVGEDSVLETEFRGTFSVNFTQNGATVDTATITVDSKFVISHMPQKTERVEMSYLHIGRSASTEYFYVMPAYSTIEQSYAFFDKSHGIWNGKICSSDSISYFFTSVDKDK